MFCKGKKNIQEMAESLNKLGGSDQLYGSLWILTGTILHSLTNVVNQKLLQMAGSGSKTTSKKPRFPEIEPESLCHIIGAWSILAWAVYILFIRFVLGDSFHTLIFAPLLSEKIGIAWVGTIGFFISSWIHALAFFQLLNRVGVVSAGMVKGATVAAYVSLAHWLYCDTDA